MLNSNRVKTEAFYKAALPYGEEAAQRLVDFHVRNGGVSRYKKFAIFLNEMVHGEGPSFDELIESYATHIMSGLLSCEIADGLEDLRQATAESPWLIVSGGDQNELREVFSARGIDEYFDGGIFGSPDTKDAILARELATNNILPPALFLGDSTYDRAAASSAGLDFVFISGWTEVPGWEEWCRHNGLTVRASLKALR